MSHKIVAPNTPKKIALKAILVWRHMVNFSDCRQNFQVIHGREGSLNSKKDITRRWMSQLVKHCGHT
jgi:hypothetical protein